MTAHDAVMDINPSRRPGLVHRWLMPGLPTPALHASRGEVVAHYLGLVWKVLLSPGQLRYTLRWILTLLSPLIAVVLVGGLIEWVASR